MLIKDTLAIKNKIHQLLDVHRFNIELSDALIQLFFDQTSLLNNLNDKDKKLNKETKPYVMMQDLIKTKLSVNLSFTNQKELLHKVVNESIKELQLKDYAANQFYQHMKGNLHSSGKWKLVQDSYKPFQPVICGDVVTLENFDYLDITPIGYFKEPFSFLALKERDVTWMSVTPFEIETMAASLSIVSGTVVSLGLGLGYFASMAAMKHNVNKVIVVEKDKRVIDLFSKHIQPLLPHQNKITLIHQDAFEFLNQKVQADHMFVDIYRTAQDGLPLYTAFKKLENKFKGMKWHYWLENSILGLFRRYLMIYLEEQLQGLKNESYQSPKTIEDRVLSEIHRINESTNIENVTKIQSWLSKENMKRMIININL